VSNSAFFPHLWSGQLSRDKTTQTVAARVGISYRAHFPAVKRYAYAIVRCGHEAEDVAQETFVRLIQAVERGEEPQNPLPWLLRVSHNVALSRVCGARPVRPLDACPEEALTDRALNPEEALSLKQRQVWLQKALCLLSPQELRCWTLRAEGLRYREIAGILEVQTGTVATLLVRAAEKLAAACAENRNPASVSRRHEIGKERLR
jgi:RNA polymerase sigma-70 factor (ECF subfamily)